MSTAVIIFSLVIPAAVQFAISRTAAANLPEIEKIAYTDFCLNEKITAGIYEL